ncbi:hypothetical protein TeGR_g9791 [Tetraparma gracilis]|uniref:Uncharacterized protein n=1 Tax=Tetraparma gracilis TaxID=2962635 RepID=A0ABQ6ML52_9STRA|nr:hypothetical protein TeGR_g9791 [Tetraparma gracilis]
MGQYEDFVSELQASIFADSFPYCSELIRGLSAEMKAAPRDPSAADPQASRLAYAEEPGLLSCLLQAVSTPVRRAALECLATASDPACCRRRVLDEPLLMSTLQDAFRDPKMPSRERAELMRTLANLAAHAPLRAELAADAGFVAFLFDAVYLASPAKGMRPAAREGVGAVLEVLVKLLEDPASHGSIPEERFEPTLCYAFNFAASKVFKILELVASNRSGLHQSSRSLVCTRLFVTNFLLAMHTREPDPEQHEEKLLQTFRVMAELSRLEAGRAYLRDYTTLSDTMLVWEMTKFLKYADVRRMMLNVCTIGPLNTDEARVRGEGDPEDFVIDADQFGEQGPPPLHFLSRPLFHQAMIARGLIEASTDVAAFLPAALELAEKSRVGEAVRAMMRRTQAGIDRGICRGGEPGGGQELRTLTKTFRLEFKYTKGYAERVGKDKAKFMFLQGPLMEDFTETDVSMVCSQAFVLQSLFEGGQAHLT